MVGKSTTSLPPLNPLNWTKTEDDFIIRQRNEKGRLWVAIAAALTTEALVRSADDVRQRYAEVMHKILYGRAISRPSKTKCLGHGPAHFFISPDKRKVRICPACKENNRYIAENYAADLPPDSSDREPSAFEDSSDYPAEVSRRVTLSDLEENEWAPAETEFTMRTFVVPKKDK
jgi:hypothetical protein